MKEQQQKINNKKGMLNKFCCLKQPQAFFFVRNMYDELIGRLLKRLTNTHYLCTIMWINVIFSTPTNRKEIKKCFYILLHNGNKNCKKRKQNVNFC